MNGKFFPTSGCIPQATKIANIICPESTNHLIAVIVLMPAGDRGPSTGDNFTLQPLKGFKYIDYECSWQRNLSLPSGQNRRQETPMIWFKC